MTTFKDQFIKDLNASFFDSDFFATAAIFTPTTGSPVSCNVIIDHDALVQLDGYEIGVTTLGTAIDAMVADVGTPRSGDTFTAGSVIYTVKRIESNDGNVVRLVVK
jgi:hypothetical protein